MKLLPYDEITIRTKLDRAEVARRLAQVCELQHKFRHYARHKPFEGCVKGGQFSASRILEDRRCDCLAIVHGTVTTEANETIVHLKIHPRLMSMLSMLLVFGLTSLGLLAICGFCPLLLDTATSLETIALITIGGFVTILAAKYACRLRTFYSEARWAENYFADLFEARAITQG